MSRRRGYRDYDEYGYVSAADRKANAQRLIEQLREEGETIEPIEAFKTRGIAKSFWGKAWCTHLEQFSDYENRLPRGRSYVRNGSVIHLSIESETVNALVNGSELYELTIHIDALDPERWSALKKECTGQISSVIELLQGQIPETVMEHVTDVEQGLFPAPQEIRFNCNCPDWADMCKHVASVMYGIGKRLDEQPELLFKLRGVDHEELISVESAIDEMTSGGSARRRQTLDEDALGDVFGIDLDEE